MTVTGESGREPPSTTALRRSEERFELLVESVVDYAIFMLDPDGIVQSWNAGAERLKRYREDEILGCHYSIFYPEDLRAARLPDRLLAQAFEEGRVRHRGWRVRKDGSRFWADVVITALFDEDGRHTGFAKVTRDMTDSYLAEQERERALEQQRSALAQLEELERWRRSFIGSILHDLQTPVTAVSAFAELLRDGAVLAEEMVDVVEQLRVNARSMQELLDNLRTYTLLAEGRVELHVEPVELTTFVPGLVAAMAPVLADHEVEVDVAVPTVDADRLGLERILRNLLANAARHTAPGTHIDVRVRAEDDGAWIEVADDGDGIDHELLPHVFDRFRHRGRHGTGLGLSIVREYVELHGGQITVDSTPGEGTTFRFRLDAVGSER